MYLKYLFICRNTEFFLMASNAALRHLLLPFFLLINEEKTDSKYISIRLYTRLRKMSTLAMFNEKHPSHCIEFQGTQ